jgi:hypothetical protein
MCNRRQTLLIAASSGFCVAAQAGVWAPLSNEPTFLNPPLACALYHNPNCAPPGQLSSGGVINATLLTEGSVLFTAVAVDNRGDFAFVEYELSPDLSGSYSSGTWRQVASLPNAATSQNPNGWGPSGFASATLPDGRVIYEGGEYSGGGFALASQGAVYDPVANSWQSVAPPSFENLYPADPPDLPGFNSVYTYPRYPAPETSTLVDAIGDSQSVVLPDGTFMIASKLSRQQALLDAKTLTWTLTGKAKHDVNSEEGWTLLPNGKVLAIDTDLDYWFGLVPKYSIGHAELYDPRTGTWSSAGSTTAALSAFPDGEMGPAVLMADGIVFATGAEGHNSLYDSATNTWRAAPSFPTVSFRGQTLQLLASDTGAAPLPNGNLLLSADTYGEAPPTKFFEFDGSGLTAEPDIPNGALDGGAELLVLPSGQILEFDGTTDVELYTPKAAVSQASYAPYDIQVPAKIAHGKTYVVTGKLINGVTQGAQEGDDFQMATNFPLVRITNVKTGHVFFGRTFDFSSMAIANADPATAKFEVPADQELGASLLQVVANGITSVPVKVTVE